MTPAAALTLGEICACRLDPNVAPRQFVKLLETLIDQVHEAALAEALGTDGLPEHAGAGIDPKIPLDVRDHGAQADTSNRDTREDPGDDERPRRIPYDVKARIRARHAEAVAAAQEEGKQRAPRGFMQKLAAEFDLEPEQVKWIVHGKDGT